MRTDLTPIPLAELVSMARAGRVLTDDRRFVLTELKRSALAAAGPMLEAAHGICGRCLGSGAVDTKAGTVTFCPRCGGVGVMPLAVPPINAGLERLDSSGQEVDP